MSNAFSDDPTLAADGDPNGRVADTGQTWDWFNDNAQLHSGRVRRNPAKPAGGATGGCYGKIILPAPVTTMSGVLAWRAAAPPTLTSQASSLVFIYSNVNDANGGSTPPTQDIFTNAVHVVVNNWAVQVGIVAGNTLIDIYDYFYPAGTLATDGTAFNFKFEIRGQIITLYPPDGSAPQKCADPRISSLRGPYLIYQCFDTVDPPSYDGGGNVTAGIEPSFGLTTADTVPLAGFVPPWPLPQTLGVELEPR